MEPTTIHPSSIVEKGAQLDQGVQIGPFCHIGSKVNIGKGSNLHSNVVIKGNTQIGEFNEIFPFTSLGTIPQDLKYEGEPSSLKCGHHNQFREYTNISIGTKGGGMLTEIGDRNLFMVNSHVAHDCKVGNDNVFANGVSLGGHVIIGNKTTLGGHVAVHQFVKIGDLAMVGAGSVAVQDVAPYCTAHGNHARVKGLNTVGLKRKGFSREEISIIKTIYRILFSTSKTLEESLTSIEKTINNLSIRNLYIDFLQESKRGLCR